MAMLAARRCLLVVVLVLSCASASGVRMGLRREHSRDEKGTLEPHQNCDVDGCAQVAGAVTEHQAELSLHREDLAVLRDTAANLDQALPSMVNDAEALAESQRAQQDTLAVVDAKVAALRESRVAAAATQDQLEHVTRTVDALTSGVDELHESLRALQANIATLDDVNKVIEDVRAMTGATGAEFVMATGSATATADLAEAISEPEPEPVLAPEPELTPEAKEDQSAFADVLRQSVTELERRVVEAQHVEVATGDSQPLEEAEEALLKAREALAAITGVPAATALPQADNLDQYAQVESELETIKLEARERERLEAEERARQQFEEDKAAMEAAGRDSAWGATGGSPYPHASGHRSATGAEGVQYMTFDGYTEDRAQAQTGNTGVVAGGDMVDLPPVPQEEAEVPPAATAATGSVYMEPEPLPELAEPSPAAWTPEPATAASGVAEPEQVIEEVELAAPAVPDEVTRRAMEEWAKHMAEIEVVKQARATHEQQVDDQRGPLRSDSPTREAPADASASNVNVLPMRSQPMTGSASSLAEDYVEAESELVSASVRDTADLSTVAAVGARRRLLQAAEPAAATDGAAAGDGSMTEDAVSADLKKMAEQAVADDTSVSDAVNEAADSGPDVDTLTEEANAEAGSIVSQSNANAAAQMDALDDATQEALKLAEQAAEQDMEHAVENMSLGEGSEPAASGSEGSALTSSMAAMLARADDDGDSVAEGGATATEEEGEKEEEEEKEEAGEKPVADDAKAEDEADEEAEAKAEEEAETKAEEEAETKAEEETETKAEEEAETKAEEETDDEAEAKAEEEQAEEAGDAADGAVSGDDSTEEQADEAAATEEEKEEGKSESATGGAGIATSTPVSGEELSTATKPSPLDGSSMEGVFQPAEYNADPRVEDVFGEHADDMLAPYIQRHLRGSTGGASASGRADSSSVADIDEEQVGASTGAQGVALDADTAEGLLRLETENAALQKLQAVESSWAPLDLPDMSAVSDDQAQRVVGAQQLSLRQRVASSQQMVAQAELAAAEARIKAQQLLNAYLAAPVTSRAHKLSLKRQSDAAHRDAMVLETYLKLARDREVAEAKVAQSLSIADNVSPQQARQLIENARQMLSSLDTNRVGLSRMVPLDGSEDLSA